MEDRLVKVLDRLAEFGLKISPDKCQFGCRSVKYLGRIISEKGVETDPDKLEALKSWPRPTNVRELRSFLGFAGCYRRFGSGYSQIAYPLHRLTAGGDCARKKGAKSNTRIVSPTRPFGIDWTHACELAFQSLKDQLCSTPVLVFADFSKPFVVHTDASREGLGVLYQEVHGRLHPVAYASRSFTPSERNYPAHKLQFLGLKWVVCEKFRTTYIELGEPRSGKKNIDADALSRRPNGDGLYNDVKEQELLRQKFRGEMYDSGSEGGLVTLETLQAIACAVGIEVIPCIGKEDFDTGHSDDVHPLVVSLAMSAEAIPDVYVQPTENTIGGHVDWAEIQRQDIDIRNMMDYVRKKA
ncbi:hypothetical protein BSL78_10080 [Apostichopus japonicus]|uniref:Reverse transcriptase/retrotransposon-derived protein RNase H-like domain-containing protein n=1 Tax=Stichopus japonicus TaxID=307972 RepID=A0A2G8KYE2_STIJA|nr:hypothetical protein BSL78_10080 [Apostichopus japonicus]